MPERIVLLTEGHSHPMSAKTATGILRYRADDVVAILDSTQAGRTSHELLGIGGAIPVIGSLDDASQADTLVIGIAPAGGKIPPDWRPVVLAALRRGMTVVAGLHDFLCDDPEFAAAAAQHGAVLRDVRKTSEKDIAQQLDIRSECLRIHTIGNDCNVGKMVTAVELQRGLARRGHDAKFVATGQTGIMVEGDGCPVDRVIADFLSGAAERLVLANQHHDILVIEGQGSLVHPSYSTVTLGLLHGTIPDGLILCYEAGRKAVRGMEHVPLPPLIQVRHLYETMANVMHPCRVIGVSLNSYALSDEQAAAERARAEEELRLPVTDVIRHGPAPLVDAILDLKEQLGK